MRLAVIGDRNKIFSQYPGVLNKIRDAISAVLKQREPEIVDVYMNPGVGFIAAKRCHLVGIPYRAIIPFRDCWTVWPIKVQNDYRHHLKNALEVIYVDRQPGYILRSHPPDVFHKEKIFGLARWLAKQLDVADGDRALVTRVIPYKRYVNSLHVEAPNLINQVAIATLRSLGDDGVYPGTNTRVPFTYGIGINVCLKEGEVTITDESSLDEQLPF